MKIRLAALCIISSLVAACETVPPVDPQLQAQAVSTVANLYERACVRNTGNLARARNVFNAHGFDNVERAGSAVYYYNDDGLVATVVPFNFTQSVGGIPQAQTRGIRCTVGSNIYRVDAGRSLVRQMAERYLPEGFYERIPNEDGPEYITLGISPDVFGQLATWDSFIDVVIADEDAREALRRTDPDAPIFKFIAGVGVTEFEQNERR
ncbi:MAG: hypothetical protein AAGJ34_08490 [Pseudomonadota bacterium]